MSNNSQLKIGACVMVHNMAPFIGTCVKSLQWVDGIFIFDDHSTDGSLEAAQQYSSVPIKFEQSSANDVAFRKGELESRNYKPREFIQREVSFKKSADTYCKYYFSI